ncbi:MAG: TaqI-like C-terminal specificity domain-containing protein [Verrucomicrobiota bacterium]|jgi:type I restriction-modification system DNA methylase subunit
MPAGFRLHPLASDSSATSQISARQVDAASRVTEFYAAFARVKQLVADFRANEKFYRSPAYQEQEARRDFIDKFWLALGWDVNHETQKNPFEQEVKVERGLSLSASTGERDGVRCRSSQRRADYAFYLAPNFDNVKFYVEAKKPHGDIATADNYFQTIRYGWSGKTKIAVLHDFEQFEIADCRFEPKIETVLSRNIRKFHFHDYEDEEKFAEIYWLFSREAVANGSLEKFAATLPKKRAKDVQPGDIDERFLKALDEFRDELARAFKNRNANLDGETLTEITQRTLDRLVFLRFLEDKHIEPQNHIAYFGDKGTAWQDFIAESRRLDGIYNGIVYKKHEILDAPGFKLDDDSFSGICERLSHLNSPYDFNAIPIHILGSIYERFLGKVIVTTDKRARLEEKPEVRKAGGVYYTPEYIVRYIVENTVGKLIAGKTPAQIAEMRFADIACGSGSFLLGVYDLLIRHHTKFYNDHPGKAKKGDVMERDDGLHLSLQKKREILLANIYGVDIDPQAVEVAQLSLYLKLLQDETPGSARNYQLEFHETLLPTLNKNIVCGNSLIGADILTGQLFASDEEKKLNPMDFEQRFPHIFKTGGGGVLRETATPLDFNLPGVPLHGAFSYKKKKMPKVAPPAMLESEGGFDAIVGNPPYVRPHNLDDTVKKYFWQHYRTFTHKSDLYCCFMENATRLLKPGGLFSYIVSHGWLRLNSFQELRRFILQNYRILQLVEFPYNVFADAQVATGIFVFEKSTKDKNAQIQVRQATPVGNDAAFEVVREIPQKTFQETFQNVFDTSISPETEAIKEKMRGGILIGSKFEICFGLKTGDDEKFLHYTKRLHPDDKRLLRGDDVKRYESKYKGEYVWYVPKKMREHRQTARPGEPRRFEQPKVLVKDTSADFACTYDPDSFYVKDVLIVIPKPDAANNCDLRFVAGVINSKALRFYYRTTFQTLHVQNEELASLPIPRINLEDPPDKARHDRMVELVEQMLAAKKQLAGAQSDKDKDFYTNRCDGLDRQIDALVYDLYALNPAEIKIVESASAGASA